MVSTGLIVVADNNDARVLEVLVIFVTPLTGAARTCCCGDIQCAKGFDILFALDNNYALLSGDRLDQFGKAVRDTANAVEDPNQTAVAVGPRLAKPFRFVANGLEQQLPMLIAVIIGNVPSGSRGRAIGLCLYALISKPSASIGMIATDLTIDQIKDATAAISFVVEPGVLI